ncbi:Panacea domain-containing protein [Bombella favorum]|uniref:Antitoxin SocA-like Panacea domain-containing protein n=1 Tax=Bombella favorum TaxID=2039164 RepID=A0ABR5ZMG3_9PROT|nr:type II toxin-antitoxin system antitoxin SocA domain-containing protein [Bombella favorum]MBA5725485.1 hypothetical protein [Bombella favorum]
MVSVQTVANRFLELASDHDMQLTPMKLLKLVYLAHGWMLGTHRVPLIRNRIEAWMYGPVVPELYEQIRHYKRNPVTTTLQAPTETLSPQMREVINRVFDTYKGMSGPELSTLTHLPNTPWEQIYNSQGAWAPIPDWMIERYYVDKIEKSKKNKC